MKCYNCGKEYNDTYSFCPYCSAANETNKCTNCGKEYDKSYNFCPHCSAENEKQCLSETKRTPAWKNFLWFIAILVFVVFINFILPHIISEIKQIYNDSHTYRVEGEIEMDIKYND